MRSPQVRPIAFDALIDELAERLVDVPGRCRVAIDGAAALAPERYADALVDALRRRGRFALHVSTDDFLRPASQRYELGRTNPDAFYEIWRDEAALRREVLDPVAPDGTGQVLPKLWRADIDRSARADYLSVPPTGIVVVSGPFLLGGGLPFELAVHLDCSAAALARRTPPDQHWTLLAYARYANGVAPAEFADMVIRLEDPRRPAIVRRP